MTSNYHQPVMLKEAMEGLNIKSSGVYIDATFGGGGHSRAILEKLGNDGKLIAFDQDKDALLNRIEDNRFHFVQHNFKYVKNFMRSLGFDKIDGILADLGVSSYQFNTAERGFSYLSEGPLDMRMNNTTGNTAADVLNTYSEEQLKKIFFDYGEINNGMRLTEKIIEKRAEKPLKSIKDFTEILKSVGPKNNDYKYMAKAFQALRIEVNKELDALQNLLTQSVDILNKSGRLVFISYHSLEDRLVKHFFKSGNLEGEIKKDFYGNQLTPFKQITRKPITPSEEEIKTNSRARSAKLRIAEMI